MNDTEDLEARLRATRLRTSRDLDARIEALLNEVETETPLAQRWSLTWVLRNRIWRSVAVAAAAALVVVGVTLLGRSAPTTLADVRKAIEAQECVHLKVKTLEPGLGSAALSAQEFEGWVQFHPTRLAARWKDGRVHFDDACAGKEYEYNPETGDLTTKPRSEKPTDMADSPVDLINLGVRMAEERGGAVTQSTGEYQGKTVDVLEVRHGDTRRARLFCDRRTHLPLFAEAWRRPQEEADSVRVLQVTYDYPDTGPSTVYDLGVPRQPEQGIRQVLGEYEDRALRFAPTYCAVIHRWKSGEEESEEVLIDETKRQGIYYRLDSYSVPRKAFSRQQEPVEHLKNANVRKDLLTTKHLRRTILRIHQSQWWQGGGTERPSRHPQPAGPEFLEEIAWPLADTRWPDDRVVGNLQSEALVCLQKIRQGRVRRDAMIRVGQNWALASSSKGREMAALPEAQGVELVTTRMPLRVRLWLNPERDYVAERQEFEYRRLPEWQEDRDWLRDVPEGKVAGDHWAIRRVTQYERTSAGHWYPSEILQEEGAYSDTGERLPTVMWTQRIYVEIPSSLPAEIFDPKLTQEQWRE